MDKVARKLALKDEGSEPLIRDPQFACETFEAILIRGWSMYPNYGSEERFPRIYRIIPLRES